MASLLLLLLHLCSASFAGALNAPNAPQFDICGWKDARPELYYDYYYPECVPTFVVDANGDRPLSFHPQGMCAGFCQVKTTFLYGQEQPFDNYPECRGPETCTIRESTKLTYAWKVKINDNWKQSALTAGIAGGFSQSSGLSQAWNIRRDLEKGQCGYWTFVPIVKTTCGTMTYSGRQGIHGCYLPPWTDPTECHDQLNELTSGGLIAPRTVRGVIFMVLVDYVTQVPLPDDMQDPIYSKPGVKIPQHYPYMAELRDFWKSSTNDLDNFATQYLDVDCLGDASKYHASDCIDAIGLARNAASNRIEGENEQVVVAAGECTIHVKLNDDAPGDCSFSYLEAAIAADNMVAKCLDKDGAPGQTFLRSKDGKCTAGLKFCPNNGACF